MRQYEAAQIKFAKIMRRLKLWQIRNRRTPLGRRYSRLRDWMDSALIIPRRQMQSMDYMLNIIPFVFAGAYFLAFLGLERHRISGLQFEYAIVGPSIFAAIYLALRHPERMLSNMVLGSAWAAGSTVLVIRLLHPGMVDARSITEMGVIGLSLTAYINALVSALCRIPTRDIGPV